MISKISLTCTLTLGCFLEESSFWIHSAQQSSCRLDSQCAGCHGKGDQDMALKAYVKHVVELVYLRYILWAGAPLETWKEDFKITMKWKRGEPLNYHDQYNILYLYLDIRLFSRGVLIWVHCAQQSSRKLVLGTKHCSAVYLIKSN